MKQKITNHPKHKILNYQPTSLCNSFESEESEQYRLSMQIHYPLTQFVHCFFKL